MASFGDTISRPKAAWLSQIMQSWRRIRLMACYGKTLHLQGFLFVTDQRCFTRASPVLHPCITHLPAKPTIREVVGTVVPLFTRNPSW